MTINVEYIIHCNSDEGSYLLRQRSTPLSRLGRQYSISSDYVADTSLYDPSYNYPSFHGISDSLRATIGDPPTIGLGPHPRHQDRGYVDSDYLLHPPGAYYPERRKKTVRFDSVNDHERWGLGEAGVDHERLGLDCGWMTIQAMMKLMLMSMTIKKGVKATKVKLSQIIFKF